ncbi:hypothetical protein OA189_03200, partial [Prochlorococcus sp. AH-716-P20]|nr:hypothetical protein [Prochlorococcus sp. AH-716-P20]
LKLHKTLIIYSMYKMEFTYKKYEETLLNAIKENYLITSSQNFIDLINTKSMPKKYIVLRHDCERDLYKAYNLAQIEESIGIKSTYFLRTHSEWYNLFQPEEWKLVLKIINLGHEIGLHYEPKFYEEINIDFIEGLKKDLMILNQFYPVNSVSAHQPLLYPPQKEDFTDLKLIDMYTNSNYKNIPYFSDSGMQFREFSLEEVISNQISCQFLIHPDFWNNKKLDWHTNYSNRVNQVIEKLKSFKKFEEKVYDDYMRNRKEKDKKFFRKK